MRPRDSRPRLRSRRNPSHSRDHDQLVFQCRGGNQPVGNFDRPALRFLFPSPTTHLLRNRLGNRQDAPGKPGAKSGRRLGDFLSVLTKDRLAARLASAQPAVEAWGKSVQMGYLYQAKSHSQLRWRQAIGKSLKFHAHPFERRFGKELGKAFAAVRPLAGQALGFRLRFQSIPKDVFHIVESATWQALLNECFQFRPVDFDCHYFNFTTEQAGVERSRNARFATSTNTNPPKTPQKTAKKFQSRAKTSLLEMVICSRSLVNIMRPQAPLAATLFRNRLATHCADLRLAGGLGCIHRCPNHANVVAGRDNFDLVALQRT